MNLFFQSILSAAPIYKYGLLFLLVLIEGPLVTMVAGWLAFFGHLNPFIAYIVVISADIVSDAIYYGIGFWGRGQLIKKYTHVSRPSAQKLQRTELLLHRHSGKSIILAKVTHVAGVPFLIAVGLARIRFLKFILYDLIATLPKSLIFIILGYYFGQATGTINHYLEYGTLIISGLVSIFFIAYLFLGKYVEAKFIEKTP